MTKPHGHGGPAGGIAAFFVENKLTLLLTIASLLLGLFGAMKTPREEEPQIVVPTIDVFVRMPGADSEEVEKRVVNPMEKLLWEIPGVEYIYSTARDDGAFAVVRFKVGEDEEDSILKTYNKLYANFDLIPPGVSPPLVKPRAIDDVPILSLTFHSDALDGYMLRRVAAQVKTSVQGLDDVSEIHLIGGARRRFLAELDPDRLKARGLDVEATAQAVVAANQTLPSGEFSSSDRRIKVEAGSFVRTREDLERLVVGVSADGRPVYLADVARLEDGPEEPSDYVYFYSGATEGRAGASPENAVTLSLAKRKGANATAVADRVLKRVEELKGRVIPPAAEVSVTRNYGATAKEKSDELLKHMGIATVSVIALIALFLGLREGAVVAVAIPVTLALTLFVFYMYGYTLNRITLFALIFSIGILVDDAIVIIENVVRHYRMPGNRNRPAARVIVEAVAEVGNPTVLATFAVVAAILPMAFVRGLMGPYMRPIPVGASAAMIFSMLVAFSVTPWVALRVLKREGGGHGGGEGEKDDWSMRAYRRIMRPLIASPAKRAAFFLFVVVLFAGAAALLGAKKVLVKMLPFDNKNEFQVIVDTPEGTTLERTAEAAAALAEALRTVPEVENIQTYAGTAAPFNFNGLVRRYYLRSGANVADLQVNLAERHRRKRQSHEIAKSVRPMVREIAARYGANVKIAEVPPGPPVLQTLVAEVYGPDSRGRIEIARKVKKIFEESEGVTDVDWYVEDPQEKASFEVDVEKAGLHGVTADRVARTLALAVDGMEAGIAHIDDEQEDVPTLLRFSPADRSDLERLGRIGFPVPGGKSVALSEIASARVSETAPAIYHKNLKPVVYVTADVGGERESPVYAIYSLQKKIARIKAGPDGHSMAQLTAVQPEDASKYGIKWDGEWHITYEVFRDLGLAFGAVMVLIYILVVAWFRNYVTPLVIMAPIPLTLVGILPAHWAMGAFFTATSMIGFIAGAGIIVRNSIILVDFIELRLKEGMPLEEAVVDAGAVRFRPMLLTASAVIVGTAVILFDPIFQGLAISLVAGEIASTLLSRMAVPVLYYIMRKRMGPEPELREQFDGTPA